MVVTIVLIVIIVVVGVSILAFRNRSARGIESGISSFRRELRALAPSSDELPRAHGPSADPPRTSGVGILRPSADEPDDDGEPDGRPETERTDGPTGEASGDDDAEEG